LCYVRLYAAFTSPLLFRLSTQINDCWFC
jgi:hypothetical protein